MSETAVLPLPFAKEHKVSVTPIRTLRELAMMRMSALIRAKPNWHVKANDPGIVARWTREAADQGMTEAQIRYVVAELAYYAALRDERPGIEVSGVDGVWQSDALIEDELRSRLRTTDQISQHASRVMPAPALARPCRKTITRGSARDRVGDVGAERGSGKGERVANCGLGEPRV